MFFWLVSPLFAIKLYIFHFYDKNARAYTHPFFYIISHHSASLSGADSSLKQLLVICYFEFKICSSLFIQKGCYSYRSFSVSSLITQNAVVLWGFCKNNNRKKNIIKQSVVYMAKYKVLVYREILIYMHMK